MCVEVVGRVMWPAPGAGREQAAILVQLDILADRGIGEAQPPGARIELGLG
jgi:hypothetical protein